MRLNFGRLLQIEPRLVQTPCLADDLTSVARLAKVLDMRVGRASGILPLVLVVSVVALFFCPLGHGSYQSTNGPTTTVDSGTGSMDIGVAVFGMAAPVITLERQSSAPAEATTESIADVVSLRSMLCTFRC